MDSNAVFGAESEAYLLPILRRSFGDPTLKKIEDDYSVMDFTNEFGDLCIELKSRRIRSDKYASAIIGENKVKYAEDQRKCIFVFRYTDAVKYITFDKARFDKYTRYNGLVRIPIRDMTDLDRE